ncbi:hypothetical protein D9613_009454 [Agrocybe pediades]|uniref:Uncharacterized protein n=1 Tax=Agrocybe pediades TaxID=84607 RepID=A0A8H4VTR6_9AGAR|nr:hypothetical protein D9613_009454 [Agrocybe pediades]
MPSMQYLCSAIRPSSLGRIMEPFRRERHTRHKAGDDMWWHTLTQVDPSTQRHTPITFGLVSITLSKISVSDALNLIKLSPRLVSCTFRLTHGYLIPPDFTQQTKEYIIHENLRHLCIYITESLCTVFFAEITLPCLVKLHYVAEHLTARTRDNTVQVIPGEGRDFIAFFQRSAFPLKQLTLDSVAFPYGFVSSLLREVPSITQLCLKHSSSLLPLFTLLLVEISESAGKQESIPDVSSPIILPLLQSISFTVDKFIFPFYRVPSVFGPLAHFNSPYRRPLRSFTVNTSAKHPQPPISPDIIVRLLELREAGANIQLNGFGSDPLILDQEETL